jgi:hypothetical protein
MFKSLARLFAKPVPPPEMVGDWLLNDRFHSFIEEPTPDNYLRLRKLVLQDRSYRASATGFDDATLLIAQGRHTEAWTWLKGAVTSWLLSPKVHQLAAEVAHALHDAESERREVLAYYRCIEGILGTGDGSRDRPYLITHAGDEYDLLEYLERKLRGQELVLSAGRSLERLDCQDGTELWFDLTDLHERLDDPPRLSKPRRPARSR